MTLRLISALLILAFASFTLVTSHAHAQTTFPTYNLADTLKLPGLVRWDYLTIDAKQQRLFITRGESVDILDVLHQNIIGSIPNTSGAHGVALAPDINEGFVSDGLINSVTIFDLTTLQTLASVSTGIKPDAIVYDPQTKRVFTANGSSNDVTVIDAQKNIVLDTIKLGGKPEFAVTDEKGHLYINIEDKAEIAVVNSKTLKVSEIYDLKPDCESPTGLAIDREKLRLFSVCGNQKMVITSAQTGKILDTVAIGAHSDAAAFDPQTGLVFSSNGEGTLTIVAPTSHKRYKVIQTVTTKPTARTMALDPLTHEIYLAAAAETDVVGPLSITPESAHLHIKPDSFMILTVKPQADPQSP